MATSSTGYSRVDLLLATLMTLVGAWVRSRAVLLVPTLTDETDEIQFALRIAQGGFFPAVSIDTYNGPVHHYLLALGLALGGDSAWPRLWSLILGALTVGLTYLLGVSLAMTMDGGQQSAVSSQQSAVGKRVLHLQSSIFSLQSYLAGLVAAALLAVSFVPVVVNSHLAWSNATTPFWTTLALLVVSEANRRANPRLLVVAGVVAGLAVQTHPTAIVPLVGAGVWLALRQPAWWRTRWPWLALLAAILALSNIIGYNLVTGGGSAEGAARRGYAFTGGVTLDEYTANLSGFVGMAYQLVGSTFISTLAAEAGTPAMRSPWVILYTLIALVALIYTARRAGLPLACWLASLLLLPIINQAYDSHISARYMAPLLPPTFAAMGVLLGAMMWSDLTPQPPSLEGKGERNTPPLAGEGPGERSSPPPFTGEGPGVGSPALISLLVTLILIVYPLWRLNEYYYYELQDGRNNARLWQLARVLREPGQQGIPIVLDRGLREAARLDAGGHVYKALGTLLDLDKTPHTNPRVEELPSTPVGALMVLTDARRDILSSVLKLEAVDIGEPPALASPGGYWLYRVLPP